MTQHYFVVRRDSTTVGIVSLVNVPPNTQVKNLEDTNTFSNMISVVFEALGANNYFYLGTSIDEEMTKPIVTLPYMLVTNRD